MELLFHKLIFVIMRGSSSNTNDPNFRIKNASMKLKRELIGIAKSEGKTLSQFCREHLSKVRNAYPESARNYQDDDDGC